MSTSATLLTKAKAQYDIISKRCEEQGHIPCGAVIAGSIAYGLDTPTSDIDIRGAALPTKDEILTLHDFGQTRIEHDADAILYSYTKLVSLLVACNPNTIEILGVKPEHILISDHPFQMLLDNKSAFVSRRAASTFGGYATQQLRRIENAMGRENPTLSAENALRSLKASLEHVGQLYPSFEASNLHLSLTDDQLTLSGHLSHVTFGDLKAYAQASLETIHNADNLVARNRKRSSDKLAKHASHLIRLLRMGSEMLESGEINTYRENDAELLLDLKRGMWLHEADDGTRHYDDAFFDLLNEEERRFNYAKNNTSLPKNPDTAFAHDVVNDVHAAIVKGA